MVHNVAKQEHSWNKIPPNPAFTETTILKASICHTVLELISVIHCSRKQLLAWLIECLESTRWIKGNNYINVFSSNTLPPQHWWFLFISFFKVLFQFHFSDAYNWILHFSLFNENKKNCDCNFYLFQGSSFILE